MKPTLFLHGLLNDKRIWEPVASRVRRHADILVPKLRRQDSIARTSRDAWAEVADVPARAVGEHSRARGHDGRF